MDFVSVQFAAFLAIVLVVYFLIPFGARPLWLLVTSLFFYGVAGPVFLLHLLAVTLVCYLLAFRIEAAPDAVAKRRLLVLGVVLLVANLAVFKYTSFANETARSALAIVQISYPIPILDIALPLGISFYTFMLIGYLVDVSRGTAAERNPVIFALYVAFFPKILAGPIERTNNLLRQLHLQQSFDYDRVTLGIQLFVWGLFQKVVVADRLAPFVASVYSDPRASDGVGMTVATWLYAFQLYCDFSGYTDMALGIAMILGFKLIRNFDRPYFATSIQDFWKRWHISLTSWLTDYVYTPLTRSKRIRIKWYNLMLLAIFVTFLVSGIWHGSQWTFVLWGALHGTYIVVSMVTQKQRAQIARTIGITRFPRLFRAWKIAVTFTLVCFALILFRANSVEDAFYIITRLPTGWGEAAGSLRTFVSGGGVDLAIALAGIGVVLAADMLKGYGSISAALATRPFVLRWGLYVGGTMSIVLLASFYTAGTQFIYVRF